MLCEVDDVRGFLQKPDEDTEQDEQITALCEAVGPVVDQFCGREFEPPEDEDDDAGLVRTFEYRGGGVLSLSPFDLREVIEVRVDVDEPSPTTLTAEEFRLPPSSTGTHTYIRLVPGISQGSHSRWPQRLVEVRGRWGFEEVPANVKQAAIITVATWLRRDVSAFSTTFDIDEQRVERPEAIPSAAARMLNPYKTYAYA